MNGPTPSGSIRPIEIVNFHVVGDVPTAKPELTAFAGQRR